MIDNFNNITVTGRYPSQRNARIDPDRMVSSLNSIEGGFVLRIDDEDNPDFWMEIRLTDNLIKSLLRRVVK